MEKFARIKRIMIASIFASFLFSAIGFAQTDSVTTDAYGQIVKRYKLSAESRDGILTFESDDKKFKTWYDARVQLDANTYSHDTYNPTGNGVGIRRARFAVKTILWKNWYGEVDLDFESSAVELKDAYILYDFGNAFVKGGHYKEPLSMETTTTSRYVTFMERSLISKMTPSRHIGVSGSYVGGKWMTVGGVFFNTVGDAEEVMYTKDNNKDYGIDEGYSLTGKLVVNPILKNDMMLHIGAAGSYRTPKTHLEVPNSYRYSTRSYSAINRKKYLDTDDISDVENTVLANVELAGMYKNFMFQGQYITTTVNRMNDLDAVNLGGFYVQAGVYLFGSHYTYNQSEGEFTRPKINNDWGALEFAVRYDYMNANDIEAEVTGGAAEAYTAGLTWRPNPNVRLMVNYSYLNHDRYANGKGKLYIYRDDAGVLYRDVTGMDVAEGEAGEKFHMMGLRVEIDF
ncbi:MAG: porin [Bacteroidota bacterium]